MIVGNENGMKRNQDVRRSRRGLDFIENAQLDEPSIDNSTPLARFAQRSTTPRQEEPAYPRRIYSVRGARGIP